MASHFRRYVPGGFRAAPYRRRTAGVHWFFRDSDRLLVGWADDGGGGRWRDHHRNLLPEEFLAGLRKKLDSSGVERAAADLVGRA